MSNGWVSAEETECMRIFYIRVAWGSIAVALVSLGFMLGFFLGVTF
jgi:hypothetical protein